MSRVIIEIKTDNAAFTPEPNSEVARILRNLADRIEDSPAGDMDITLRDVNGNTVGEASYEP